VYAFLKLNFTDNQKYGELINGNGEEQFSNYETN
jgi:hypothetical protein